MRRLPPNKIEQSLSGLLNLLPDETDELLQRVDQPLEESIDPESVCSYISIALTFFAFTYCSCRAELFYSVITIEMAILIGNTTVNIPHIYLIHISLMKQDLLGQTNTSLLLMTASYPPRNFVLWKWRPMNSSTHTVSCISREAHRLCTSGTLTMDSPAVFLLKRVSDVCIYLSICIQ